MPRDDQRRSNRPVNRMQPAIQSVDFQTILSAFIKAGCLKVQTAVDHGDTLLSKFRTQLKRHRLSVEKFYKLLDPDNHGSVPKKDFIYVCFVC